MVAGSEQLVPRSKAVIESKSRVRANLMSRSSAARTAQLMAHFREAEWLVSRL